MLTNFSSSTAICIQLLNCVIITRKRGLDVHAHGGIGYEVNFVSNFFISMYPSSGQWQAGMKCCEVLATEGLPHGQATLLHCGQATLLAC
jgi:hypothetical protein